VTRDPQPPTGETIAAEIEREMEERLYPLRNVTLAPAEYHVYLHPDDFAYIEGIVPRIVEDVQTCLNALVQRLNRRSIWSRLTDPHRLPPIEVPSGGWAVHLKASTNDEVNPGEIGIHSRLTVPANARFGSGAGTIRITETLVAGGDRRSRTRTEPIPFPPRTAASGAMESSETDATAVVPPPLPRVVTLSGPRLHYRDDDGEHVHPINKDLTKIGRGGAEHWVDVMVSAGAQVSREHCRIRRDASGRLFLQDVSTWGTYLNGAPVEKFVDGDAPAHEREIVHGASIRLADAVTLELLLR
jgi:FHA domain-containing protein